MNITIYLNVLDIDEEYVMYILKEKEERDRILWKKTTDFEPAGDDYSLVISTNKDITEIEVVECGNKILTKKEEIKELFAEAIFNFKIQEKTSESDGLEYTDENEVIITDVKEERPYDPKLIRVDPKQMSIEHICKLIAKKRLDIAPNFQRGFVWTEITRKSRLIESILLRIPLPVFYLSQDEDGYYQVVDGIQRLTVINDFVHNKFKLKNLEYLTFLEGKWFNREDKPSEHSLPEMYSARIEETQLFFNIIDPSTPVNVKYDIFRRLNTGGKSLNAQEIRNCLSNDQTREFLKNMTTLDSFLMATNRSISSNRMADRELALRFSGFYILDNMYINLEYKGDMDLFLNQVNSILNTFDNNSLDRILDSFDNAMKNAYILFGKKAFRKTTHINKALFLSWSRQLYKFDTDKLKMIKDADKARKLLEAKIKSSVEYSKAITNGTNDISNIKTAFDVAGELLEEIINEE